MKPPQALVLGSEVVAGSPCALPFSNAVSKFIGTHYYRTWAFSSPDEARQEFRCSVATEMRRLEVSGLGRGLRRSGIAAHCHVCRMAAAAAPVCRHPASHEWF